MPRVDDEDDPWAIPEDSSKNRKNLAEKARAMSLNDRHDASSGDNNNQQQSQAFGGFSVPKSGSTFGGGRNNRGAGGGEKSFSPFSNSFGGFAQRGRGGSTPGGGLASRNVNGSPGGGFQVPDSAAFGRGNQFRRNFGASNISNMGGFAPPINANNMEPKSDSSDLPRFSSNGRQKNEMDWPEDGTTENQQQIRAESSNRSFGGFSNASAFSKNRDRNDDASSRRSHPTFQNEKPTSSQESAEDRDKAFWAAAASRPSAMVPAQPAPSPLNSVAPAFGGFTPPVGRPLFGRGPSGDGNAGIPGRGCGTVAPIPRQPPQQHTMLFDAARRTSQEAGGEDSVWFAKDEYEKPMPSEEISLLNKILHKKLENLQNGSLEISQARSDPNSPLYSATSFQSLRLKEELLRALDKMGFHMPSKIQEAALPLLLIEPPQNMIAQAQSGTGKTAAFVLTMLSRVVPENKWPQCLCLAPTYELAMQIGQVVQKMGEFLPDIKIRYAVKGERITRGEKIEEQIIIGTPGKMLDWVLKLKLIDSSKIICLVLDEADVMISQQGHQDQSIRLHSELHRSGAKYQSLLFSATYDEDVRAFADSIIKDAVNITLRRDEQTLKNIKQYYVKCANREEKYEAVMNLYGSLTIASAIIFCYTRKSAEWLASRMSHRGHEVTVLHGDMTIEERARIIQQFKDSTYKVLITTNVCARGIDVCQVSVVINYDPPVTFSDNPQPDYETYIHRIGRTGRFGKAGIAINLVSDDFALRIIQRIGDYFGVAIEPLDASGMDQLEAIDSGKH